MQRGVVERHPRSRFAVIADHDYRRAVVEATLLQRGRQSGDCSVRITPIDLNEKKEALTAAHLEPALGGIDCQRALALERGHFVAVWRGDLCVEE